MKREDKFGRRIFSANIWSQMLLTGKKLVELGYIESVNKPNLFYSKKDYGLFFADMRGTEIVPIWDDPIPLFYWNFDYGQPNWKCRRHIKEELLRLGNNGVKVRLTMDMIDASPCFENTNACIDTEDLIFDWNDGYCEVCGKDFQNEGYFCSTDCEKKFMEKMEKANQEERLRSIREGPLIECCICKKNTRENPETVFHKHHTSYFPEKTVITCLSCHQVIHNTEAYPHLRPKNKRLSTKEIRELERIARIELAKRNGTYSENYCSICGREIKAKHSYSFYYGKKIHTECLKNKTTGKK